MSFVNEFLHKRIVRRKEKSLENRNFSLISSNCTGGFISHDLELQFRSPFINLWMSPRDFIKCVRNLKEYMKKDLSFVKEEGVSYPIGMLGDVKVYFQHYTSEDEAKKKWNERKKRIDYNNLYVLMTDRDGCTMQDLEEFDHLPVKNKVVLTHQPYSNIKSSFYLKGFEKEQSVGQIFLYPNKITGKRYYDQFNYVNWFNGR